MGVVVELYMREHLQAIGVWQQDVCESTNFLDDFPLRRDDITMAYYWMCTQQNNVIMRNFGKKRWV